MEQKRLPFDSQRPTPETCSQDSPKASSHEGQGSLEELASQASACRLCGLREEATQVVFGEGNPRAHIMLIGEGPGRDEDLKGRPFVGRAGQLLDRILEAAGLDREDVYITNVVKCRPPGNRTPTAEEIRTCLPWLKRQVSLIDPYFILLLGRTPAQALLGADLAISRIRGTWHTWEGYMVMPTFHPAALLRDPSKKGPTWQDVKKLLRGYQVLAGEKLSGHG